MFQPTVVSMKFILIMMLLVLHSGCNLLRDEPVKISGAAQGTTYHITYFSESNVSYKKEIDSLLGIIDLSLSTYIPNSIISRINNNDSGVITDGYFQQVFNKSIEISKNTGGLFDVTVAQLINAWGFGPGRKMNMDSLVVDSLRKFTGYQLVRLEGNRLIKEKPAVKLDFNAIAQGYTVDVLAEFLEQKGIMNYLVELGGEVKAKGRKDNDSYWTVGIDEPNETYTDGRPLQAVIELRNNALATSGNYRKYIEENGKKYTHIINPKTGYPSKHHLLSATVIASDCMTADAYATAFMVMGLEASKKFLSEHKQLNLEVYFIYDENGRWKTYASGRVKEWLREI
jgi:FAD:protein FMN transferase